MGIYAFEIENSLIFSIESTKLKYKTANKRHELTYEDKHGMKGAIKVRECLQVLVGKAWVNYSAQF